MLVSIVDSSLDSLSDKLKCVLFAREQNMFPAQAEVGDIIRMHRLKVRHLTLHPYKRVAVYRITVRLLHFEVLVVLTVSRKFLKKHVHSFFPSR